MEVQGVELSQLPLGCWPRGPWVVLFFVPPPPPEVSRSESRSEVDGRKRC
jgi:hypothetical protein